MNAVTNTVGVNASIGTSKSKTETEINGTSVVKSNIAGGDVNISAYSGNILVQGSQITGTNSATLKASDSVTIKSAEELYNEKTKSSNSSASIGVNVGVGITGTASASASVNASAGNSSSDTHSVNNVNSIINGGNNLSIVSGKDTIISGANISAKNVDLNIGRNLTIASVQDTMNSKSSSSGVNVGVSVSSSTNTKSGIGTSPNMINKGGSLGVNVSSGSFDSKIVNNQTSVTAEGGALNVKVGDTTTINGGLLAAKDADGKDSGNLNLTTGKLVVTDLMDTKNSKDVSIGISSDVNNPFKKSESNNGNTPTIDGSYSNSTFAQDTKGTIGNGNIQIADATSSTPLEQINRDITNSQVVTKDKQSGFTAYYDKGAIDETKALLSGDKANSLILQTAEQLKVDPAAIFKAVKEEVSSIGGADKFDSKIDFLAAALKIMVEGKRGEQSVKQDAIKKQEEVLKPYLDGIDKRTDLEEEEKVKAKDYAKSVMSNNADLLVEMVKAQGRFEIKESTIDSAIDASKNLSSAQTPVAPKNDNPIAIDNTNQQNVDFVIVTGERKSVDSVLEKSLELTGRAAKDPLLQEVLNTINTVQSFTPKGILTNLATSVVNKVTNGGVDKLTQKGDELATKAGKIIDDVVSKDDAAKINADYNNRESTTNEVTGGKVLTGIAATVVVGKIGEKVTGKVGETIKNDVNLGENPISATDRLKAKKAKGEAFEKEYGEKANKELKGVVDQITVKTESGVKTRLDFIGSDKEKGVVCIECKSSETAPLTKNQKIAFPEIEKTGATVVGNGKGDFTAGVKIPAVKVKIVRPTKKNGN